jgi:hypothetical protein
MSNFPDLAPGSLTTISSGLTRGPDFAARLRSLLPPAWFPDNAPVLTAILEGFAATWSALYALLTYVQAQDRIGTATGGWLDGKAMDFLGPAFIRRLNESDAAFSLRVRKEILRPRNTRAAIIQVLQDLTGNTPTVFRPTNASDTGGYGRGGIGYGVGGGWGSLGLPFQALITIKRGTAPGAGQPSVSAGPRSGYGTPGGGWGVGSWFAYGSGAGAVGGVTDADIYAAVASVTPAGHINWVRITN